MRQKDRFERVVERASLNESGDPAYFAAQILRRQYAALRRLVKKQRRWEQRVCSAGPTPSPNGRWIDWKDLRDAMDRWKKGAR